MTRIQIAKDIADSPTVGPWSRCEELIEAFENAWRSGPQPSLDDFLQGAGSERDALLVELAHVDLEFRLKAGQAARVESYLDRYPLLAQDNATVLGLLEAEYELRQRSEGVIDLSEYARRFPAYMEELRGRLASAATLVDGQANHATAARGDKLLPEVPGYEIIEEIGRGGMGVVYRARQLGLHRTVALKMVLTAFHSQPKNLARLRTEAATLARLQQKRMTLGRGAGH